MLTRMWKRVPISASLLMLASGVSFIGCSAADDPTEDPEFEADYVENFEEDLEEDAAQEAEQAELDTVDDMDDVEVLDEEEGSLDTSSLFPKKVAPMRQPHGPLSIIQDDAAFSGLNCVGTRSFDAVRASDRVLEAKQLGADIIRVSVSWANIAPNPRSVHRPVFTASKPSGYNWTDFDIRVGEARNHGMKVLLTLNAGGMPYWASEESGFCAAIAATGPGCSWKPKVKEYAAFAAAVARHVKQKRFRIWGWTFVNAPNLDWALSDDNTKALASRYRKMWFAARKAIRKTAGVRARVLFSDLAAGVKSNEYKTYKLFKNTLCMETADDPTEVVGFCPTKHRKVYASGVAFHPYGAGALDVKGAVDLLADLVDRAEGAGSLPRNRGVYITEAGFLTAHGAAAPGTGLVVTPDQQAVAMNVTDSVLSSLKRVKTVAQYQLVDSGDGIWETGLRYAKVSVTTTSGAAVAGDAVEIRTGNKLVIKKDDGTTTTLPWGEIAMSDGRPRVILLGPGSPKPAYNAYRISANIVRRTPDEVEIFGLARADTGAGFTIEGLFPSGWQELTAVSTDAFGYGRATVPIGAATAWRIRFGTDVSREVK